MISSARVVRSFRPASKRHLNDQGLSPIPRERFYTAGLKPGSYFNVGWDAALKRRTTRTLPQALKRDS